MEAVMKTIEQTTDEILTLAATHFKVPRAGLQASDDFYKSSASTACRPWNSSRAWKIISAWNCRITKSRA